jgi:hypothetical protein
MTMNNRSDREGKWNPTQRLETTMNNGMSQGWEMAMDKMQALGDLSRCVPYPYLSLPQLTSHPR